MALPEVDKMDGGTFGVLYNSGLMVNVESEASFG